MKMRKRENDVTNLKISLNFVNRVKINKFKMGLSLPGKESKIYTSQWIETFTDIDHLLVDEGVVHMEAEHWLILRAVSNLDLCVTQRSTPIHCPGVSYTGPTHA